MDETNELRLLSSHDEVGNVRTFVFETGGIHWIAGQSQGYRLDSIGGTPEENERWFTIASAPHEREIHISTRVTESKFKQALNAMQPGDRIVCYGLEGDFTWEEVANPVVLVAGGIGITPFRSILLERHALGKPLNATLIYFNRTDTIPFMPELRGLTESHPEFELLAVVGEDITADSILGKLAGDITRTILLSGPEPMVEAVGSDLKRRGVQIRQDWFPGYDEKSY